MFDCGGVGGGGCAVGVGAGEGGAAGPLRVAVDDAGEDAAYGASDVIAADVHAGGGDAGACGCGIAEEAVGAGLGDEDAGAAYSETKGNDEERVEERDGDAGERQRDHQPENARNANKAGDDRTGDDGDHK